MKVESISQQISSSTVIVYKDKNNWQLDLKLQRDLVSLIFHGEGFTNSVPNYKQYYQSLIVQKL